MSVTLFSPKQIAKALGVSESSVKRWVDSGRLTAARTAGGHRKVPLPSVVEFVRETGHALSEPEVLGMAAAGRRGTLEASCDRLYTALVGDAEPTCRELVLGAYQQGESIAEIGDRLIGPVFSRIGDAWASGEVSVHQERRACEIMMATLHELRRWLHGPEGDAPTALVATPHLDFSEVPIRLVELVLSSEGWSVTPAGSGLPLEEIRKAVLMRRTRLVCVSVTHLEDPDNFVVEYNELLVAATRQSLEADGDPPVSHVIGGGAVEGIAPRLRCDLFARSLSDLVKHQRELIQPQD